LPTSNCNFKNFSGVIPPDHQLQGEKEGGRGRARVKTGREGKGGAGREEKRVGDKKVVRF
jgi:hypothetical protein